jgi:type VI secretion system FHA domain protein
VTLTLELTAASGARPGDVSQRVFGEEGGSIGRAPNNTWVLSHNKVSGRHANITCRGGVFYIEDVSRNGVCVNSPENRLTRNRPYALKTGDRILIEPYEIGVWIEGGAARATGRQPVVDPFADLDPFAAPVNVGSNPLPEVAGNEVVDPLLLIPGGEPAPRRSAPPPPPSDNFLEQHYQPPAVLSPPPPPRPPARDSAPPIPAGYNPLAPDDSVGGRIAPPRPRPAAEPIAPPGYNPLIGDDLLAAPTAPPPAPPEMPVAPPPVAAAPPPPPPAAPPVDPFVEPPPSGAAIRPRPGIDATPARRRAKEPSTADSQTTRLPDAAVAAAPTPSPTPPSIAPAAGPPSAARRAASGGAPAAAQASPAVSSDLTALLAGAGVPDGALTPELAQTLGQILRVVVSGLMDVLQSRQRIKEEFGMQQTVFRPADNNPLKFSANVEDALHNLLVRRTAAYLAPVDAFSDAFDDLRDHQLAVLAGMRVAFEAMLAEFDPDRLQQQFDKQMGGGIALTPAKMRYWELFRARRADMAKDPEETFERLFGEEFRRAYEEQFRQLKAQRRQRKDAGS